MDDALGEANASPVILKKFSAYNLLGFHRIKTSGKQLHRELDGYEIESKLEADTEGIFQKIRNLFVEGNAGFLLPHHFPYVIESSSINRYYMDDHGLFKALFRGNQVKIVRKGSSEPVKNTSGLDCMLKRRETKGDIMPISSGIMASAQLRGELQRKRKAFWINNPKTQRSYHISLDNCIGPPGNLYEVEIEYVGRHVKSETHEGEIIEDIDALTSTLLRNFPELRPSRLTKQDWLGIG